MDGNTPLSGSKPQLIGRQKEMEKLKNIFGKTKESDGSTVFISGEAGIGKTRLVKEFKKKISKQYEIKFIEGVCFYENMAPLMPFKEAFRNSDLQHIITEDPHPKVISTYLVDENGLLIKKSDRGKSDLDPDIFASMLETIKSFVKDSLSEMGKINEKSDGLNLIGYDDYSILIQSGERYSLAAIIDGEKNEILIDDMDEKLTKAEEKLESWDGDLKEAEKVEEYVSWFTRTDKYKGEYLTDDPEINQENLFDNVLLGLQRLATEKPVILFLDDLQWADPTTLSLLQYLSRNTQEDKILILGTYRPEDIIIDEESPFKKTLQNMNRDSLYEKIDLKRLKKEDSESIVKSVLGHIEGKKDFSEKIYDEAEGNPFFILEIIELLVEEGYIIEEDDGWKLKERTENIEIPPRVVDVIERRLDRLSKEQNKILSCGSIEGDQFSSTIISKVLDIEKLRLLEELNEIESRYKLIHSSERKYEFDHGTIRDVLYNNMNQQLRKEYHKNIAETYEGKSDKDSESDLETIAHHYYKAKDERGISYLIEAAERSKDKYANEEAISFYKNAISLIDDDHVEESKKAYLGLGDSYKTIGDFEKSLDSYRSALELIKKDEEKAKIYGEITEIVRDMGDYKQALEYVNKGLNLALENNKIRCELLKEKGLTYIRQSEYEKAETELLKGKELSEEIGDENKKGSIYLNIGVLFYHKTDYEKSEHFLKQSIDIFKNIEDTKHLSACYNNLALIYSAKNEPNKSLEYHEKCLEISKEVGRKKIIAISLNNIGNLYLDLGQIDKGLENHLKSLKIKKEMDDKFGIATSLNNIGDIYLTQGRLDEAMENQKKALDISERLGYQKGSSIALHNLGEIYLKKDELEKASEYFQKSIRLCKEIGRKKGLVITLCKLSEVYILKNKFEEAEENIKKALKISKETNSKVLEGRTKRVFGMLYREQERWDEAIKNFEQGIEIFKESENKRKLSKIYFEYGILFKQKCEKDKAKKYLQKSLKIFEEMEMKIWIDKNQRELSDL